MTISQEQLNRFFEIIANSKLNSELDEALVISSDDNFLSVQKGEEDARKAKPSLIRGFLGLYNAATDTPPLSNSTGVSGDSYEVSVSGTRDFGNGSLKMSAGDIIEFRNTTWRLKTRNVSFSEFSLGTVPTASGTTTNQEIEDYINLIGFSIDINQIKILSLNVYINGVLYTKLFWHKDNFTGNYGTGNTTIIFQDLLEFEVRKFNLDTDTTVIIELGDIGSSTISAYINANDEVGWDLQAGIVYIFEATIDDLDYSYLYVGQQPKYLGLSQQQTIDSDFLEISAETITPSTFEQKVINIIQDSSLPPSVPSGTVNIRYNSINNKIASIVLDRDKSKIIEAFDSTANILDFYITITNITKNKSGAARIIDFNNTNPSSNWYEVTLDESIERVNYSQSDAVEIHITPMMKVLDEDNLSSNSSTNLATQQSIKAYVDNIVSSGVTIQGGYDSATNTPDLDTSPTGINKGYYYIVTSSGQFYSSNVEVGDSLIALVDNPSQESDWIITQTNLDAASIKTLYESNADTNAFTDALLAAVNDSFQKSTDDTDDITEGATNKFASTANVDAAGAVMESDYDVNTILAATADNTPVALTVEEQTFVGRISGGNITALTLSETKTALKDRLLENAAVTGAFALDYAAYELWNLTLTAAASFTESNLEEKTILIRVTGDFALTFPANWSTDITGVYDGTVSNIIVVQYFKSGVYKVQITQPD